MVNGLWAIQISEMLGALVKRASSVGSVSALSRRSTRSNESIRSIPARDERRLALRLNAVIAGSGVRVKECRESIELLARLRARRLDRMLIASGTVEKRFEERSNDVSDPASGANADVVMDIKLFSARHKWRKKRHLIEGRVPMDVMSELEP